MIDIFKKTQREKYAVGAFNVSNLEQLKAIAQAAENLKAPVIIATSQGESKFLGKKRIKALVSTCCQETGLPMILHLDHGKSLEVIRNAVRAGYDSVHFDGSELEYEENVKLTKKAVDFARKKGVKNIEGELGYLRGKSAVHKAVEIKEEDLTKAEEVLEFVQATGVDSLAISIGNVHGVFNKGVNPHLFLDRLKEINEKVGDKVALVLHGGSGTPKNDIEQAIELGIDKINVNTELRVAYTKTLKKVLKENPKLTTPYKLMPLVVEAVQKVVEEKIKLFGSQNKA